MISQWKSRGLPKAIRRLIPLITPPPLPRPPELVLAALGLPADATQADIDQLLKRRSEELGLSPDAVLLGAAERAAKVLGLPASIAKTLGLPASTGIEIDRELSVERAIEIARSGESPDPEAAGLESDPAQGTLQVLGPDKEVIEIGPVLIRYTPRVEAGHDPGAEFDQVPRLDPRSAAGAGEDSDGSPAYVAFRRDWLDDHGLRAEDLALVDVLGERMEPTIRDGDVALVDRSRIKPLSGRIYALRTPESLEVARLRLAKRLWRVEFDHPDHAGREFGNGDQVAGRVVWWAHAEG